MTASKTRAAHATPTAAPERSGADIASRWSAVSSDVLSLAAAVGDEPDAGMADMIERCAIVALLSGLSFREVISADGARLNMEPRPEPLELTPEPDSLAWDMLKRIEFVQGAHGFFGREEAGFTKPMPKLLEMPNDPVAFFDGLDKRA